MSSVTMQPKYETPVEWLRRYSTSRSSQVESTGRASRQSRRDPPTLPLCRGRQSLVSRQLLQSVAIPGSSSQSQSFVPSRSLDEGLLEARNSPLSAEEIAALLEQVRSQVRSLLQYRGLVFSEWAKGITFAFIGAFAFATHNIYAEQQRAPEVVRGGRRLGSWRDPAPQSKGSPRFGIRHFSYRIIDYPPRDWTDLKHYVLALFGHSGPVHLIANSLAFYSFCSFLMPRVGIIPASALFVVGGTCANLGYAHIQHAWLTGKYPSFFKLIKARPSPNPQLELRTVNLGASLGTAVMTGLIAFAQPQSKWQLSHLVPIAIPAYVYVGAFAAWSAWSYYSNVQDGIGHGAHLAGLTIGAVIYVLLQGATFGRMLRY